MHATLLTARRSKAALCNCWRTLGDHQGDPNLLCLASYVDQRLCICVRRLAFQM